MLSISKVISQNPHGGGGVENTPFPGAFWVQSRSSCLSTFKKYVNYKWIQCFISQLLIDRMTVKIVLQNTCTVTLKIYFFVSQLLNIQLIDNQSCKQFVTFYHSYFISCLGLINKMFSHLTRGKLSVETKPSRRCNFQEKTCSLKTRVSIVLRPGFHMIVRLVSIRS